MAGDKGAPVYPVTAQSVWVFGLAVMTSAFAQTLLYVGWLTELAR